VNRSARASSRNLILLKHWRVPAAALPWAPSSCGPQVVAAALFPGGRRQTTSRLPGRRRSSTKRADRRSPRAPRFDRQRERPQALRDLSRFRGLGRSRLLASPTSPQPVVALRTPGPADSSRAAVTAASIRGGLTPCGLTATAADNPPRSAGRAVHTLNADYYTATDPAHRADVVASFAVRVSSLACAPGTTASAPHPHPNLSAVAVSAHDVSLRAPLASAGSSDAGTQGGSRSSATRTDRGQRSAPTRRRQRCAVAHVVGTSPQAGWVQSAATERTGHR
jgi:hypothetical protein